MFMSDLLDNRSTIKYDILWGGGGVAKNIHLDKAKNIHLDKVQTLIRKTWPKWILK